MPPTPSTAVWLRFALLVVLVVAGLVVTAVVGVPDVEQVRATVDRLGAVGLAGFVLAYASSTLLFLPKGVVSAAAGLVYGLAGGVALVWAGAMLGASVAFWLGRALGRDAVERLAGRHLAGFDRLVERHGILAVLFVRLAPVIPFTAVNYAAGLTAIPFRSYTLGTAIGIIPGTVAYVALGAYGTDPGSWQFATALGAFLALTVAGAVAVRRQRRRPQDPEPPADPWVAAVPEEGAP